MSACVSAKVGGMFASSGAILAMQDATGAERDAYKRAADILRNA